MTVVKDRTVMLRLENGRVLDMRKDGPPLRPVDRPERPPSMPSKATPAETHWSVLVPADVSAARDHTFRQCKLSRFQCSTA